MRIDSVVTPLRIAIWLVLLGIGCACASAPPMSAEATDRSPGADDRRAMSPSQEEGHSRISDEVLPLQIDDVPGRPRPLIELGDPFLGTGPLSREHTVFSGAVVQPALTVFGTYRTAFQDYDNGLGRISEWANRLDLFANLQLTGTERILLGVRPLHQDGQFSGYTSRPDSIEGWDDELNTRVTDLFFEGDLGDMLPGLDPGDNGTYDYGFSVGRQTIQLQQGILLDDRIDSIGITRNTLLPRGTSNLRITGLFGWSNLTRESTLSDNAANLIALSAEADTPGTTLSLDTVYVFDSEVNGDALYFGAGAVQRIASFNTTLRVASSLPDRDDSRAVSRGTLLLSQISRTLTHSEDIVYFNAFWGIDRFTSVGRASDAAGPLGAAGILFSEVGLGRYGAPLGSRGFAAVGGALGYQHFLDGPRTQIILELGARDATESAAGGAVGVGARFQKALGQRTILRLDGFLSEYQNRESGRGVRLELLFKI